MKIKCEYCGAMIEDSCESCPNCGGANVNVKRTVDPTPQTIEQLKQWYEARKLPPYETTRFFIGIDYKEPRAFGIYRDGSEFVVYKNKDDGSRAIRYRGTDEAYAVNELYLKIKSEILNQKAHQGTRGGSGGAGGKGSGGKVSFFGRGMMAVMAVAGLNFAGFNMLTAVLFLLGFAAAYFFVSKLIIGQYNKQNGGGAKGFRAAHPKLSKWLLFDPVEVIEFGRPTMTILVVTLIFAIFLGTVYNKPHYYMHDSHVYVSYHNDWYEYDSLHNDYYGINHDALPAEIQSHPADYEYDWNTGNWNTGITEFKDSQAFADNYNSTDWSSSDSDYNWDSGDSWDSGSTDWGSDW